MTIAALRESVRAWENYDSLSDALIDSFVTLAEEWFNEELLVDDMITVSNVAVSSNRITLPADFIDLEYVRHLGAGNSASYHVLRSHPLDAVTKDEYWRSIQDEDSDLRSKYCKIGNYIYLAPEIADTTEIELAYYAKIPALSAGVNWLYTKKQSLYLFGTLAHSSAFGLEPEKAQGWRNTAQSIIDTMNARAKQKRYGQSSRLRPHYRTFG